MHVQLEILDPESVCVAHNDDGTVSVYLWDASDQFTILFRRDAAAELANHLTPNRLQNRYDVPF